MTREEALAIAEKYCLEAEVEEEMKYGATP